MALLTRQTQGPDAGNLDVLSLLVAATGGGDSFFMTGKEILVVNNGSGGTITVTISTVVALVKDNFGVQNAAHDLTFAILAGKLCFIGPLSLFRFKDSNGNAQITYSGVTTLTVGVFALGTTA